MLYAVGKYPCLHKLAVPVVGDVGEQVVGEAGVLVFDIYRILIARLHIVGQSEVKRPHNAVISKVVAACCNKSEAVRTCRILYFFKFVNSFTPVGIKTVLNYKGKPFVVIDMKSCRSIFVLCAFYSQFHSLDRICPCFVYGKLYPAQRERWLYRRIIWVKTV